MHATRATTRSGMITRAGTFSCRADAISLLGLLSPVQANPKDSPCAPQVTSILGLPPVLGAVDAVTDLTAGPLPAAGDEAYGYASVAGLNILGVPGHEIKVGAVMSAAEALCVDDGSGHLSDHMYSMSTVATLIIDGYPISVAGGPQKISIGNLATVWLNRTTTRANSVRQRALEVDLLGMPIAIVGETQVDRTGNPCGTALMP